MEVTLDYQRYLGANPYKGFVPFMGSYVFPHSMEFCHIPLNKLIKSERTYDWTLLDINLKEIDQRCHHAILRFYMDYPTLPSGVPAYLLGKGLKLNSYEEFGGGLSPDYENKNLIDMVDSFLDAYAQKYDGDKRIAFLECGLIGHWGEWHTYPHDNFMPCNDIQNQYLSMWKKYIKKTFILFRYPDSKFSLNGFGFHDDSFCYSTLTPGDFLDKLSKNHFEKTWMTYPIGGEIRPEEQESLTLKNHSKENYHTCTKETHASWMINQFPFEQQENTHALFQSSSLGYDLWVSKIITGDLITITIKNSGVAPFYFNWYPSLLCLNDAGVIVRSILHSSSIKGIQPKEERSFSFKNFNDTNINIVATLSSPQSKVPFCFSNKDLFYGHVLIFKAMPSIDYCLFS